MHETNTDNPIDFPKTAIQRANEKADRDLEGMAEALKKYFEKDPHGKDPHESGAKLDQGKLRYALVLGSFALAIREVVKVGTYGANKYSDNGWLDVPDGYNRYSDAQFRHWFDCVLSGRPSRADDSELLHLSHECWNALGRLELFLREENDISS